MKKQLDSYLQIVSRYKVSFTYLSFVLALLIYIGKYYEINKMTIFLALIFVIGTIALYINLLDFKITTNDSQEEKQTDEQKLLNVKRKFLDDILEKLKLEIDKELSDSLESGEIEEANRQIEDKINSLNKLVETVKGNNAKVLRGTDISSIANLYDSTNNRIKEEIKRISNNSTQNMLIGLIASTAAIGLLVSTIQQHEINLMIIIPRATVSILIEAFAFFFFSQYRKQQEEIKYWNNEKTNLDLKIFALSLAIDDEEIGTKDYMRNLITTLIQSNRNIFGSTPLQGETKEEKPKEPTKDKSIISEIFTKAKDLTELISKNKDLLTNSK